MRSRRGFSLFELMVVMGLGAILFTFAVLQMRGAGGRAGAHALAQLVTEDLRAARQQAIARRRPVAVVFPTSGGTLGHATSLFVMEGEAVPRITRVRDYSKEFAQAQVFLGTWPTAAAQVRNPDLPGNKWTAFKPDDWLPATNKKDYCFIFMPDGSVRTNDLPAFSESYHLAIVAGSKYSLGPTPTGTAQMSPGPSYHRLERAGDSFTISLSPAGAVTMGGGLTGQDGTVATSGSLGNAAGPGAPPPSLPATVSSDPEILGQPTIYPPQDATLLPDDIDAVVTRDQFLSLEVIARSPTGDQLFCNWQVIADPGNSQPGTGTYSIQNSGGGGRMEWDPEYDAGPGPKGAWRATWQWRPPPTAIPLDRYQLACAVKNYDGGTIDAEIQHIVVIPPGRILFETDRTGTKQVWSMNEDGSQQLFYQDGTEPTATLNASRIVFVRGGNLFLVFRNDPTQEVQLTTTGNKRIPSISPNGNWIAYREQGGPVMVMKTEAGATPRVLGAGGSASLHRPGDPLATEKITWSPDGRRVLFNQGNEIAERLVNPGPGGEPIPGAGPTTFMAASQGGQGGEAVTSPSWGVNGMVYAVNNFHTGDYDPYMFFTNSSGVLQRWNVTVGDEEAMVERDPGGSPAVLEEFRPLTNPEPQIGRLFTNAPPPMAVDFLTSQGSNTRPVWTR